MGSGVGSWGGGLPLPSSWARGTGGCFGALFWVLVYGASVKSVLEKEKSEKVPRAVLARGGRGSLPRARGTKRRRRRVEPGILLLDTDKSSGALQKRPALSCAQRGQDGAKVSSSLAQLGENTPSFPCFYPKELVPSPAATPGAEGSRSSSCLWMERG